jgi:hypothetical protein
LFESDSSSVFAGLESHDRSFRRASLIAALCIIPSCYRSCYLLPQQDVFALPQVLGPP